MARNVQWKGLKEYTRDVEKLNTNAPNLQREFMKIAEKAVLDILKANSPRSSGSFADSWKVVSRSTTSREFDTDQPDVFFSIVNGAGPHVIRAERANTLFFRAAGRDIFSVEVNHPGNVRNPFIEPVARGIDKLIERLMDNLISKHFEIFRSKQKAARKSNLTRTVGLTGTNVSRSRGRGKISLVRARTGRRQFKRRLGRRRRTGKFVKKSDVVIQ